MPDQRVKSKKLKILIIEDSKPDARLIEIMLREPGTISFATRIADRLSSALEILSAERFDLLMLDLALPDSMGIDTLKLLFRKAPETPIIVLTGMKDEEAGIEAMRQGAQDYLVKGEIGSKLLIRSIQYAIERKQGEEERKTLRAQLINSQKMEALGTLAGGIAHDFNNLLTVIRRNIETAKSNGCRGDEILKALTAVEDASNAGHALVRRLLNFGRPAKTAVGTIALDEIAKETIAFLRAVIPPAITIETRLCRESCLVKADPSSIGLIITNLFLNAKDAMPHGGTLLIETCTEIISDDYCSAHSEAKPGEFCMLRIKDNGAGMSCELIDRIFEPFFTTKGEKGTGLGLSMVYTTVKSIGGWIQCQSSEGVGTEFILHFPLVRDGIKAEHKMEAKEVPEKRIEEKHGDETILLADDEEILLLYGQKVLEENGYRVLAARDGEEALALFRARKDTISLAIIDVVMPGIGGIQVMEEIKKLSPHTPVIISSSYSYDNIAEMSGGQVCEILPKDYSPSRMLEMIRNVLAPGRKVPS